MHPVLKAHYEAGHFSHGYLLVGEKENSRFSCRQVAAVLLNCREEQLDSHPDFLEQFFNFFGLEEANTLKQKFSMKPILAEKRVFLLEVDSFDHKAIAGLSKILEDPPNACYSFFIATFAEDIPAVLRSRLVNLFDKEEFKLSGERRIFYDKFLKSGRRR